MHDGWPCCDIIHPSSKRLELCLGYANARSFLACYRMRFSLPDLGDEDTLWEIFQECVSRCDCQPNSIKAAALALLHPNLLYTMGELLHVAQCDVQQVAVSCLALC